VLNPLLQVYCIISKKEVLPAKIANTRTLFKVDFNVSSSKNNKRLPYHSLAALEIIKKLKALPIVMKEPLKNIY